MPSMTRLLVCALAVGLAAAAPAMRGAKPAPAQKNIVELASATAELSTLVTAVKAAGLVDTLSGKGPFTVFAPTNKAFAKLPKTALAYLLDPHNAKDLAKVLTYHVAAGAAVFSKSLKDGEQIKTVEGEDVTAHVGKGGVKINDADVTTADVAASNGVVHVIDSVLMPPDLSLPSKTVVDIATSAGGFKTLVKALTAASLVDTLEGDGPFTVFAPTDDAFAAIPPCHLRRLLADKKLLTKVLTYHVLPTRLYSDEISKHDKTKTVEGESLLLEPWHNRVYINRYAEVVKADIEGSNGNVHAINRVLFPLSLLHDFHHAGCPVEDADVDASTAPAATVLSTFDGASATTLAWREVNDPVMGGQSTGTFTVDAASKVGVFAGEVKIVPFLHAPGFANMQTKLSPVDVSAADALQLVVRSTVAYKGFKAKFGPAPASGSFFARGYAADFNVDASAGEADADGFQTVTIPFTAFSSHWSDKTGEPTIKCSKAHPEVCPDAQHLKQLNSLEISAEGVAGQFHLEVRSIGAVSTKAKSAALAEQPAIVVAM